MCGIWQLFFNKNNFDISSYIQLFYNIQSRGPDATNLIENINNTIIGFHRLAINDISTNGMQPFYLECNNIRYTLICNGEIYNYKNILDILNYIPKSNSDCEILIPLFIKCNDINKFLNYINGEFSLILTIDNLIDNTRNILIATDPHSVRPLFYQSINNNLLISSLIKGLSSDYKCYRLLQGQYIYFTQKKNGNVIFNNTNIYNKYIIPKFITIAEQYNLYKLIVNKLINAVKIRLHSNRPICCLLSGGLDSSLVAAITQRLIKQNNPNDTLHTFTIGMKNGSDLLYAKQVANHINSIHTEIYFTPEEGINVLNDVIYVCETYDITTIRASVGQYLLAKYISEKTDFKVVLNGDGADEIAMGYLYFFLAPTIIDAQNESLRLIKNICKFDGLRVDRCLSNFGLEARLPFLDKHFVNMYLNLNPLLKKPTNERMEKFLIRTAFAVIYNYDPILPNNILWRKKEAFSDGVSNINNSWFKITQEYCKSKITNNELELLKVKHKDHMPPYNHESAYYRKKFIEYFGTKAQYCIPYYWLPKWSDTTDPSARTLNIYNDK